jgi:hypothetical protein
MPQGLITAAHVLGIPFLAGVNLYLTVFVLGLVARFGNVLSPQFDPFAAWPVIIVAGVLTVVEVVADKIPAVDHAWDAIHTFIRIPAAMVVAGIIASGNEAYWVIIAVLIGGAVSFTSHSAKTALRITSTKTTAAHANAAISLGEDVFVLIGSLLGAFSPLILAIIVIIALLLIFFFGPKIARSFKINILLFYNWVAHIYVRVRRFFERDWEPLPDPLPLPRKLRRIIKEDPPVIAAWVIIGKVLRRRLGWLLIWPDRLMLVRRGFFRKRTRTYRWDEVESADFESGWFSDRIYLTAKGKEYVVVLFKGRTPYSETVFAEIVKNITGRS